MNALRNLSKSAQRKLKRHKIIPASLRAAVSVKVGLTRKEIFVLGLQVQSGTQDHLWSRGEEMAKLYHLKRIN
jgi:hypothetical protein